MSAEARRIQARMKELGNPEIAAHSQRFFKTGPGEYGAGDRFLGIRVPAVRKCVREFRSISTEVTVELLQSPLHEVRLLAVLILVEHYASAKTAAEQNKIYRTYLDQADRINNWDLVDSSAHKIVGAHLLERSRKPLYRLVKSSSLWERRISMMATYAFIRARQFDDTLALAERLLNDPEDLIHKVVGWMLREVGNRDRATEEAFLDRHYRCMPRILLRYAIEKFPEAQRQAYLQGFR